MATNPLNTWQQIRSIQGNKFAQYRATIQSNNLEAREQERYNIAPSRTADISKQDGRKDPKSLQTGQQKISKQEGTTDRNQYLKNGGASKRRGKCCSELGCLQSFQIVAVEKPCSCTHVLEEALKEIPCLRSRKDLMNCYYPAQMISKSRSQSKKKSVAFEL